MTTIAPARALLRDERGSATVETVLAVPVLMLLILLIAQFALAMHAQHVAHTAATQGLAAARVHGGSVDNGHEEADAILSQLGSGPLHNPAVTVDRGTGESTVDVRGEVTSVVPFLHLTVHGRAAGPTERFTGASG